MADCVQGEIDSDACKDNKDPAPVSGPLSAPQELKKVQVEREILKIRAKEKLIPAHQTRKAVAAERKQKREEKDEVTERLRFRQEVVRLTISDSSSILKCLHFGMVSGHR